LLGELELVLAAPPRPCGMGTANGQVNRDDELASANDHEPQDPIETGDGMFELATPPAADEPEVSAVLAEKRIINAPSPRPTAGGGGTVLLGRAPHGKENLEAQWPQPLEPGAFGQSPQEFGGDMFVPPAHSGECVAVSAAKERGKQDRHDFAHELWLRPQAA